MKAKLKKYIDQQIAKRWLAQSEGRDTSETQVEIGVIQEIRKHIFGEELEDSDKSIDVNEDISFDEYIDDEEDDEEEESSHRRRGRR